MSEAFVICQVCGEKIAIVDPEKLLYPMRGEMFKSPDPVHGYPDPFEPGQTWEEVRCPYGRIHRPFFVDNEILTDQGIIKLYVREEGGELKRPDDTYDDNTVEISDEEAERMVRERLYGKTEEEPGQQEDQQPIEEEEKESAEEVTSPKKSKRRKRGR
jgi:hypothetical protein